LSIIETCQVIQVQADIALYGLKKQGMSKEKEVKVDMGKIMFLVKVEITDG
jgi:hypothetical protein